MLFFVAISLIENLRTNPQFRSCVQNAGCPFSFCHVKYFIVVFPGFSLDSSGVFSNPSLACPRAPLFSLLCAQLCSHGHHVPFLAVLALSSPRQDSPGRKGSNALCCVPRCFLIWPPPQRGGRRSPIQSGDPWRGTCFFLVERVRDPLSTTCHIASVIFPLELMSFVAVLESVVGFGSIGIAVYQLQ